MNRHATGRRWLGRKLNELDVAPDVIALRAGDRLGWGRTRGSGPLTASELLAETDDDGPLRDVGPVPPIDSPDPQVSSAAFEEVSIQGEKLTTEWLDRLVLSRSQFTEKMTWFWHGHFATGITKVNIARLMAGQNNTQRRLASGSFLDLAQAMAIDPAMIFWLDGQENRQGAPNENLGRELMELFVLGVGHYTEDDVKQAARALTGWTVDRATATGMFRPADADPEMKTVLGASVTDVRSLVSMLVARPESARFLAGRVWTRFVSSQPPPENAIERLTSAFGERRDIRALMRAAAAEPAFSDPKSVLVKQPVEWAVGLMRVLGVPPSILPNQDQIIMKYALKRMGQIPFDPPNVGGWPADGAWLTSEAALARLTLAERVVAHADLSPVADTGTADRAESALQFVGIPQVTERTRAAMRTAGADPGTLVATAACSPEYVVSR